MSGWLPLRSRQSSHILRHPRIEGIAQPVADEVHGEHGERQEDGREQEMM